MHHVVTSLLTVACKPPAHCSEGDLGAPPDAPPELQALVDEKFDSYKTLAAAAAAAWQTKTRR